MTPDTATRTNTAQLGVVVVDDSTLVRQRVRDLLAAMPGVEIQGEAASGNAGLALLERFEPDVVVLDLRMPDGTGFDVLRAAKAWPRRPLFIVLTSLADEAARRRALADGAAHFFDKARDFEAFLELMSSLAAREES